MLTCLQVVLFYFILFFLCVCFISYGDEEKGRGGEGKGYLEYMDTFDCYLSFTLFLVYYNISKYVNVYYDIYIYRSLFGS